MRKPRIDLRSNKATTNGNNQYPHHGHTWTTKPSSKVQPGLTYPKRANGGTFVQRCGGAVRHNTSGVHACIDEELARRIMPIRAGSKQGITALGVEVGPTVNKHLEDRDVSRGGTKAQGRAPLTRRFAWCDVGNEVNIRTGFNQSQTSVLVTMLRCVAQRGA